MTAGNNGSNPNVLFIICDDLNNAVAHMGRVPFAPAPNLERLMCRGVRFVNNQSNCPICRPSRNSLFSGLYPHKTGHFTLWDDSQATIPIATTLYQPGSHRFPPLRDAVMIPKHFKDHGYETFGAGKTLHEGMTNQEWWTEYAYGPDYGPMPNERDERQLMMYEDEPLKSYADRYEGIDRFFLDGRNYRHHIDTTMGPLDELFVGKTSSYRYVSDEDRDPLPDEKTTAWGVEILNRNHDKPFLLCLGFMKPHTPLNAPRKYFDLFPLDQIPLPAVDEHDLVGKARAMLEHDPYGFLVYHMVMKGGEKLWREYLQSYLACVAFVDELIGKVLDALDRSPYRENTIIIFTSDNGYHLGEKHYLFKDTLWEEATQVPLIISAPGVTTAGAECDAPVSLIDIYPTLIDLCGLPPSPHAATHGLPLDGHSLRPLLENPAREDWPWVALSSVRWCTGVHHSVRSRHMRYILCQNGEEELYDHQTDPHEWHNLSTDKAYEAIKHELRRKWLDLVFPEG